MIPTDGGTGGSMSDAKVKALDIALAQIEREYGQGTVMRLGEVTHILATEVIPTGSLALDMALGVGGDTPRQSYRNIWR